jgi:hypothetical protein
VENIPGGFMKNVASLPVFLLVSAVLFSAAAPSQAGNKNSDPLVLTGSPSTKKNTSPDATTSQLQTVPLDASNWTTVYDGYGSVTYDSRYGIVLEPQAATAPSITHAALTMANLQPAKNFSLSVTANTTNQLRLNSPPNPWEVCWIFFNYQQTETGKKTNYVLLKPTGIELGTAYEEVGQTFLYTEAVVAAAIGVSNKFDVQKIDSRVTLSLNGQKLVDYNGPVIDSPGSIGIYTEDARVHVTNVQFAPL